MNIEAAQIVLSCTELKATSLRAKQMTGFAARDLGIALGTRGLASARVLRNGDHGNDFQQRAELTHDYELAFMFLLRGSAMLTCDGHGTERLAEGDAFVVPAKLSHALTECSVGLELLEVTVY